jgi:hypothetical protein
MGLNKKLITTGEAAAAGIVGTDHFDIATYTGNGSTQAVTTSTGSFTPDLVWVKDRDNANPHEIADSVRGVNYTINSNATSAEYFNSTYQFNSFNSGGFTVTDDSAGNYAVNGNGIDYVGWCWRAAGAAVSGTGTNGVTSVNQSANTDAGFSIVEFSTPASGNGTATHGLSETPELIIYKRTSSTGQWTIYHSSLGVNQFLFFTTTAATTDTGIWSTPSSTTIPVNVSKNVSGSSDYIAYCFHSVDGYQKIGSYTGSGSAGNKQTTDFQPRFLLIKRTDSSSGGAWFMFDSARSTSDPRNHLLRANVSNVEDTSTSGVDFESDGFSFNSNDFNESSPATYIYLAIA